MRFGAWDLVLRASFNTILAMLLASLSQWDSQIHQWLDGSLHAPLEDIAQLVLAAIMGGIIGIEREIRGREAGFRTYMLVCAGTCW